MKRTASPSRLSRLPANVTIEAVTGDDPALVLAQSENRVRVELAHVKGLVAAIVAGAPSCKVDCSLSWCYNVQGVRVSLFFRSPTVGRTAHPDWEIL